MKKIWILFGFPLVMAAAAVSDFDSFSVNISKIALGVTNPVGTIRYICSTAEDAVTPPDTPQDEEKADDSPARDPFEEKEQTQITPSPTPYFDTGCPIVETVYSTAVSDIIYKRQNCFVKNLTQLPRAEVEAELLGEMAFRVEKNSDQPQILIMHTHATESYQMHSELFYDPEYTCRTTDTDSNMVSVGKIIADKLNSLGYNTLHDVTLHDYPSYNESYGRSKQTVQQYLAQYPSIKVVLDVHRDAIERSDGTRIKPVVTINGRRCAQVMIISGADNGNMNMPHYKKNLRFASHFQNSMETLFPTLTRPILFDYRNYNQQLTTGSLLVEVGGHANTLTEAQNSALLIAYSLADVFDKMQ
ncbi:MAG: stage II sporulation protein P [Oscillospiraceae bacterium]|nr:stage II sporulation protein P [Oscillospiraceae bacterium]